jgi:hypothetical protein
LSDGFFRVEHADARINKDGAKKRTDLRKQSSLRLTHMRTPVLRRSLSLVALALVVVNCGLLKKGGEDAGDEGGVPVVVATYAAAVPVAPAALATNEGDVARFPDETKLADVPAVFLRSYNVREAPPAGTLITGLPKGTNVTQVASRDKFFLITFDNAKAPGTRLMGWVHKDAFSATLVDAGIPTCAVGEVLLVGDSPFCAKPCNTDGECPAGQACKGSGTRLLSSGKSGDNVQVCTVFHPHDAGAAPHPTVVDSGAPAVRDAGGGPAVVDSGPGPTPTGPAADVVAAQGGACPANFVLIKKTNKCHRPCPGGPLGGECRNRPFFCITCDGTKKVCGESQTQCR